MSIETLTFSRSYSLGGSLSDYNKSPQVFAISLTDNEKQQIQTKINNGYILFAISLSSSFTATNNYPSNPTPTNSAKFRLEWAHTNISTPKFSYDNTLSTDIEIEGYYNMGRRGSLFNYYYDSISGTGHIIFHFIDEQFSYSTVEPIHGTITSQSYSISTDTNDNYIYNLNYTTSPFAGYIFDSSSSADMPNYPTSPYSAFNHIYTDTYILKHYTINFYYKNYGDSNFTLLESNTYDGDKEYYPPTISLSNDQAGMGWTTIEINDNIVYGGSDTNYSCYYKVYDDIWPKIAYNTTYGSTGFSKMSSISYLSGSDVLPLPFKNLSNSLTATFNYYYYTCPRVIACELIRPYADSNSTSYAYGREYRNLYRFDFDNINNHYKSETIYTINTHPQILLPISISDSKDFFYSIALTGYDISLSYDILLNNVWTALNSFSINCANSNLLTKAYYNSSYIEQDNYFYSITIRINPNAYAPKQYTITFIDGKTQQISTIQGYYETDSITLTAPDHSNEMWIFQGILNSRYSSWITTNPFIYDFRFPSNETFTAYYKLNAQISYNGIPIDKIYYFDNEGNLSELEALYAYNSPTRTTNLIYTKQTEEEPEEEQT